MPELVEGLNRGDKHQVLLGVTGSGKTYSMAQVISRVNRPTLVMAHNKTLAAQLFQEFRRFFPDNAVEYFVSYYDYYQPEAYVPASDTYIEKESTINDEIDKLRHSTTHSLLTRRDRIRCRCARIGSPPACGGSGRDRSAAPLRAAAASRSTPLASRDRRCRTHWPR